MTAVHRDLHGEAELAAGFAQPATLLIRQLGLLLQHGVNLLEKSSNIRSGHRC